MPDSRAGPLNLSVMSEWLNSLQTFRAVKENGQQYFAQDLDSLITSSTIHSLQYANGPRIYHDYFLPALQAAEREVILVTCFWASSSSLSDLSTALLHLSLKSIGRGSGEKIRVYLCFSSQSLIQKLFHTTSPRGCTYSPNEWATKLGLPSPGQLSGLDLQVKSLFFRPFSVLHPKFVIIDRRLAFIPSCNVSWEKWCECFISLEGPLVESLLQFWHDTWARESALDASNTRSSSVHRISSLAAFPSLSQSSDGISHDGNQTTTILLPSRHHSSLLKSFPFLPHAAPPTPLNTFLLTIFAQADYSIFLLTPNLTSAPVLKALLKALTRGVNVHIITNRRMMVVEQLVTAATLTEICVWRLVRAYQKLRKLEMRRNKQDQADVERILEHGSILTQLGSLKIQYFRALRSIEAHKTHIKYSMVDDNIHVLGSGNMDRASWHTSQELGVAFLGDFQSFARELKTDLVLEDYFK